MPTGSEHVLDLRNVQLQTSQHHDLNTVRCNAFRQTRIDQLQLRYVFILRNM